MLCLVIVESIIKPLRDYAVPYEASVIVVATTNTKSDIDLIILGAFPAISPWS